ncbi:Polyphenol oxidase protein [Thalictrum thalictroides]|uniref:Polyphenol oxidase protein n=1 Tax=Thalictrum thalictroides TaxID=46969 RepID=A0A7J6VHN3_THATH|nr:Polyphenol oxidase protein [Thalictrum thalictroides]
MTTSPTKSQFAGSFVNVPHKHGMKMNTFLRLEITDLVEDIGAEDDDKVMVSLVPRQGKDVSIQGIKIVLGLLRN